MNNKVVYPGTFDPITNGHVDVIERAASLFDEVIVGVAHSQDKQSLLSIEERELLTKEALAHINNVTVKTFNNLLIDFVASHNAKAVVRGLRTASDFDFECQLAGMNRQLKPEIETLFFTASEKTLFISSTLIREIAKMKGDISAFVPPNVLPLIASKFK